MHRIFGLSGLRCLLIALTLPSIARAQVGPSPRELRAVQVDPTVIRTPAEVQGDRAAVLIRDVLRNALRGAGLETPESAAIRAHIVLDVFASGRPTKRVAFGFDAGLNRIDGTLVFQGEDGKN